MKNKQYYIDLSERWFEALLTEEEEDALKAFLASTDDPDFDEVKAVAGYFATGKAVHGAQKTNRWPAKRQQMHRLAWVAIAVAASLALFAAIGLYNQRQNQCYILAYGEKSTDQELALESMEATLSSLFGTAPDIENELETLLK